MAVAGWDPGDFIVSVFMFQNKCHQNQESKYVFVVPKKFSKKIGWPRIMNGFFGECACVLSL